ncbi:MAG: LegC family aminotransferase [Halioglobus sp.]
MKNKLIELVRDIYKTSDFVPLHAPLFSGNEKAYISETIDSTFVSSVGEKVGEFESHVCAYTGSAYSIAVMNGTAALQAAMHQLGVTYGDLVITQSLSFVATCNAIRALGADPIFVDVSKVSMGMCPESIENFLEANADVLDSGECVHKETGKKIKAVVPMHTLGHPVQLDELLVVCSKWNLDLIEDAAESLGSFYNSKHTGTFGKFAALSFNGNKIITTGGGGMILARSEDDGAKLKHITTTAKVPHRYEFYHDEFGFNFRMPNINAALGVAQFEQLPMYLESKRGIANIYADFFQGSEYQFFKEPPYAKSNYWLSSVVCRDEHAKHDLLEFTNDKQIMTRPLWQLLSSLPMYSDSLSTDLSNSKWFSERVVSLPSSPNLFSKP